MSLPCIVLPEAEEDVREAVRWYEEQRQGLGVEFLGAIDAAMSQIVDAPRAGSTWLEDERFRRLVLRRFPYLLFYELLPNRIEVVAVAHARRAPGYWRSRIPGAT